MLTSGVTSARSCGRDPGRKRPETGPFSSHIARDGDRAHFLDPAGGPKFEVMPLVLTLFLCFKKINFPPLVVKKIQISSQNDSILYDQDTLEVGTK